MANDPTTTEQETKKEDPVADTITIPKAEFEAQLNKIRADEKRLRMADVEAQKSRVAALEAEKLSLAAQLQAMQKPAEPAKEPVKDPIPDQKPADPAPAPKSLPVDVVTKADLNDFAARVTDVFAKQMQEQIASVRAEQEDRLRRASLDSYRRQLIADASLDQNLAELVRGDDEAAIKASVEAAASKQKALEAKILEQYQAKLGENVPRGGLSPAAELAAKVGDPLIGKLDAGSRSSLAKLPDTEFAAVKERLIAEILKGK